MLISVLLLVVLFSAGSYSQVWKSDEERLLEGEILISFKKVPDTLVNEVQARIHFDAPPEMVWEVLTDYQHYEGLFDDITTCKVINEQGDIARLEVMINNLWPYPNFNYTVEVTEDEPGRRISWKMDEGNLRMLYGSASLAKFPEGEDTTRLTYSMVRDPGWLLPFVSPTLNNRSAVVERLMSLRRKIREKKAELEGNKQDIKPKWEKALFWWQKDEDKGKKKDKQENKGSGDNEKRSEDKNSDR